MKSYIIYLKTNLFVINIIVRLFISTYPDSVTDHEKLRFFE